MAGEEISTGNVRSAGEALRDVGISAVSGFITGAIGAKFPGAIPDTINNQLIERANLIGEIGSKGINGKNTVGVCAEFQAANEMLNNGGNLTNIRFTEAVRPRNGKVIPTCSNCIEMFYESFK